MPKVNQPKDGPIERPSHLLKVAVNVELVTQELATQWLDQSPAFNRGIGPRVVYRYASAMSEQRWWFTGESIIFDSGEVGREVILDGWHRLSGVKESGVATWFVVVRGVPRDAFHYIDHGRGRVFRDTLLVLGNTNSAICASATSYLTHYLKFGKFAVTQIEDHERWKTYTDFEKPILEVQERYNRRLPATVRGAAPGLLVAVHLVLRGKDAEAADEFMDLLVTGEELDPNDPIQQMRKYIRTQSAVEPQPSGIQGRYGSGLLKAWNAHRKGEHPAKWVVPTSPPEPI